MKLFPITETRNLKLAWRTHRASMWEWQHLDFECIELRQFHLKPLACAGDGVALRYTLAKNKTEDSRQLSTCRELFWEEKFLVCKKQPAAIFQH